MFYAMQVSTSLECSQVVERLVRMEQEMSLLNMRITFIFFGRVLKHYRSAYFKQLRRVFRTQSNIYNLAFFTKRIHG